MQAAGSELSPAAIASQDVLLENIFITFYAYIYISISAVIV